MNPIYQIFYETLHKRYHHFLLRVTAGSCETRCSCFEWSLNLDQTRNPADGVRVSTGVEKPNLYPNAIKTRTFTRRYSVPVLFPRCMRWKMDQQEYPLQTVFHALMRSPRGQPRKSTLRRASLQQNAKRDTNTMHPRKTTRKHFAHPFLSFRFAFLAYFLWFTPFATCSLRFYDAFGSLLIAFGYLAILGIITPPISFWHIPL